MFQPQLLTIDFLGASSNQKEIPHSNSAMDCSQQSLHTRSIQSCLGQIRPHMLHQLLSHGCFSDPENVHREKQIGVCEGIKTLDLFPQHPLGFESNSEQEKSQPAFVDSHTQIGEAGTTNPTKSVSNSEDSREGGKQSQAVETSNFNLPMAKRLSLQRFLEKRKDRLSRLAPYMTASK